MSQFFNISTNTDTTYTTSLILVGPLFQIIGGLLLVPWVPDHIKTTTSRTHKWRMIDMLIFSKISLLSIHHMAVIICFAGALFSSRAIGFAVLTLVTELNAVTNKTRILHVISYTDTQSLEYKINSYINILTFFLRILIIFWMNNQAFQYFVAEPSLFYGCCSLALLFVNLWNLTVFKTLIVRDVLQKPKEE